MRDAAASSVVVKNMMEKDMKDQLSALIDGEFELTNAEYLITSAKSSGDISQCWAQYHLIGDIMRGDNTMPPNFKARVMQTLEIEPALEKLEINKVVKISDIKDKSSINFTKKSIITSMPIWSVAASVTAVMFVGYMVLQQNAATSELAPIEIAQSLPLEYLQAHHNAAPNAAAYYMQAAYAGSAVDSKQK